MKRAEDDLLEETRYWRMMEKTLEAFSNFAFTIGILLHTI